MIKSFADKNHFHFINYYYAMVDGNKGLRKDLTIDDVHCTINGYKIMESILTNKIKTVLNPAYMKKSQAKKSN